MHPRVIYNHQLVEARKARLSLVTSGALYGRGVFTTLAVYRGRPFLWPQHWMRLVEHAGRAGVDCSGLDEAGVGADLIRLVEANRVKDGRARVTLFGSTGRGVWNLRGGGARKTGILIMTGEQRAIGEEGLAITLSPFRINSLSPLAGVKSNSYLEHVLSWEEARARDFDEAVTLNERGEIVSATMANIFWVTGGTLHTPTLSTGALSGTTRARVISLANELSIPHVEGVYDLSQLSDADEIFLTSAGLGIAIVTTFDFHRYRVPIGSVAVRLHEAFRQLTLDADS